MEERERRMEEERWMVKRGKGEPGSRETGLEVLCKCV